MSSRILFLAVAFLLSLAAYVLSSAVKIVEAGINESEFRYHDGSARARLLASRRPLSDPSE